jgi:hypothetical protein
MASAEVVPVFEAGEAGQGVKGMNRGEVGVGDFSEEAFEGGDAEGHARGVEDCGIQLFEVIAAPFFPAAPLPFGLDEAEAFFDM